MILKAQYARALEAQAIKSKLETAMKIVNTILNKFRHQNKDEMSFKTAMDLCSLPVVTFYQGDQKLNFLLDTGSNDSIIDSNVLKKVKHAKCDQTSMLFGLEGETVEVGICRITLEYNSKEYTYDYLIKDMSAPFGGIKQQTGVVIHGIIGSSFFNKFKYVLDFAELIAYSKA